MSNKQKYLEPASSCIEVLGGAAKVARYLECHPSTVGRWRKSKLKYGTGGCVPYEWHDSLLSLARSQGIEFKREYFVNGFPKTEAA